MLLTSSLSIVSLIFTQFFNQISGSSICPAGYLRRASVIDNTEIGKGCLSDCHSEGSYYNNKCDLGGGLIEPGCCTCSEISSIIGLDSMCMENCIGENGNNFYFFNESAGLEYCVSKCPSYSPDVSQTISSTGYQCSTCNCDEESIKGFCRCLDNYYFNFNEGTCVENCPTDNLEQLAIYFQIEAPNVCFKNGCLLLQNLFISEFNLTFSSGKYLNPGLGKKGRCVDSCSSPNSRKDKELCLCLFGYVFAPDSETCIPEQLCWDMGFSVDQMRYTCIKNCKNDAKILLNIKRPPAPIGFWSVQEIIPTVYDKTLRLKKTGQSICVSECPSGYKQNPDTFECEIENNNYADFSVQVSFPDHYIEISSYFTTVTDCSETNYEYSVSVQGWRFCSDCLHPEWGAAVFKFEYGCDSYCVSQCSEVIPTMQNPINIGGMCRCPADAKFYDPDSKICRQDCPAEEGYLKSSADQLELCIFCKEKLDISLSKCESSCSSLNNDQLVEVFLGATCSIICACPEGKVYDPVANICLSTTECHDKNFHIRNNELVNREECWQLCPKNEISLSGLFCIKCIDECDSHFGEIFSNKCRCPFPKKPYFDVESRNCVSQCETGKSALRRICLKSCPNYKHFDSSCTDDCTTATLNSENPTQKGQTCKCKSDFPFYDPYHNVCLRSCKVNGYKTEDFLCVSECQNGKKTDLDGMTCVNSCSDTSEPDDICQCQCPPSSPILSLDKKSCLKQCPPDQVLTASGKECLAYCDGSDNMSFYLLKMGRNQCVEKCPDNMEALSLGGECQCRFGFFLNWEGNECQSSCCIFENQYTPIIGNQCVKDCLPFILNSQKSACVITCPKGEIFDPLCNLCVSACPASSFANDMGTECVPDCSADACVVDSTGSRCLCYCPDGEFLSADGKSCSKTCQVDCSCSKYRDTQGKCVDKCDALEKNWFANNKTKSCQKTCENVFFIQEGSNFCEEICPVAFPMLVMHSNECLTQCNADSVNSLISSTGRECLAICTGTENPLQSLDGKNCLISCPEDQFKSYLGNKCLSECSTKNEFDRYYDNLNKSCVPVCDGKNDNNFLNELETQCLKSCSKDDINGNKYVDTRGVKCVSSCNYFNEIGTNCLSMCGPGLFEKSFDGPEALRCVQDCGTDYKIWNQKCQQTCEGYFTSVDNKTCLQSCSGAGGDSFKSTGNCVSDCRSSSLNLINVKFGDYCQCSSDFPINLLQICSKECSKGYKSLSGKDCVSACDGTNENNYISYDGKSCVKECKKPLELTPSALGGQCLICPYLAYNGSVCLQECDGSEDNKLAGNVIYQGVSRSFCLPKCNWKNGNNLISSDGKKCVESCNAGEYLDEYGIKCVKSCSIYSNDQTCCVASCDGKNKNNFFNPDSKKCDETCVGTIISSDFKRCVKSCDVAEFIDAAGKLCVKACDGTSNNVFISVDGKSCVGECTNYFLPNINKCIDSCSTIKGATEPPNFKQACTCPLNKYFDSKFTECIEFDPNESLWLHVAGNQLINSCSEIPGYEEIAGDESKTCSCSLLAKRKDRCLINCADPYGKYKAADTIVLFTKKMSICTDTKCDNTLAGQLLFENDYFKASYCSCVDGYFFDNDSKSCVSSCPSKFYTNIINKTCEPCSSPCLECSSNYTCLSCNSGFYLDNDSCFESCTQINTWPDTANRKCAMCDESCDQCSGSGNNKCTRCRESFIMYEGKCIKMSSCPKNYFVDLISTVKSCTPCDTCCDSCMNLPNYCLTCPSPLSILADSLSCVSECPGGYWESNKICVLCDPDCKHCSQTSGAICTKCDDGKLLHQGKCLLECPHGFYSSMDDFSCKACSSSCSDCFGPEDCLSCKEGLFLFLNTCVSACPEGFYADVIQKKCFSCSPKCKSCNGPGDTECQACNQTSVKTNAGTCDFNCLEGTFLSDDNKSCMNCDSTCKKCFGPKNFQCLECKSGFLLTNQNTCISKDSKLCPAGQGFSSSIQDCTGCANTCFDCDSKNSSSCSKCSSPVFLLQANSCLRSGTCPSTTFDDYQNGKCSPCTPPCKNCANSTFCLDCLVPTIVPLKGICVTNCQPNCLECVNSTCKTCLPGFFWNSSNGTDVFDTCKESCLEKTKYIEDMKENGTFCKNCALKIPYCYECSQNPVNCTRCLPNYYLVPSDSNITQCKPSCPQYQAGWSKTAEEGLRCTNCSLIRNMCENCVNSNEIVVCLKCYKDYFLTKNGFCCKSNEIESNGTCIVSATAEPLAKVSSTEELKNLTQASETIVKSLVESSNSASSFSVNNTNPCGKSPTCSGKGVCRDNVCVCKTDNITGKFCQYERSALEQISKISEYVLASIEQSINDNADKSTNFIHSNNSTNMIVNEVLARAEIPEINNDKNLSRSVNIISKITLNDKFELDSSTILNSLNAVGYLTYANRFFDKDNSNDTKSALAQTLVDTNQQLIARLIPSLENISNPMSLNSTYKNFTGFDVLMTKTVPTTNFTKDSTISFNNLMVTIPLKISNDLKSKLTSSPNDYIVMVSKSWDDNPYYLIKNKSILTAALSVDYYLKENGKAPVKLAVENLDTPIQLVFAKFNTDSNPVCAYWNSTDWSTAGIKTTVYSTNSSVVCETPHLSEFSLINPPDNVAQTNKDDGLSTIAIVLISLGAFFFVLIFTVAIVYIYKKRKEASYYEKPYAKEMEMESQIGLKNRA